jgi:oxidoreductase
VTFALTLQVNVLAKAMLKAGHLGSEGLPKEARATKAGPAESQFTLIVNSGALALGKSA